MNPLAAFVSPETLVPLASVPANAAGIVVLVIGLGITIAWLASLYR